MYLKLGIFSLLCYFFLNVLIYIVWKLVFIILHNIVSQVNVSHFKRSIMMRYFTGNQKILIKIIIFFPQWNFMSNIFICIISEITQFSHLGSQTASLWILKMISDREIFIGMILYPVIFFMLIWCWPFQAYYGKWSAKSLKQVLYVTFLVILGWKMEKKTVASKRKRFVLCNSPSSLAFLWKEKLS